MSVNRKIQVSESVTGSGRELICELTLHNVHSYETRVEKRGSDLVLIVHGEEGATELNRGLAKYISERTLVEITEPEETAPAEEPPAGEQEETTPGEVTTEGEA